MLCYVIPMLMTLVMHLCSPCNRRTINFCDDDDDDDDDDGTARFVTDVQASNETLSNNESADADESALLRNSINATANYLSADTSTLVASDSVEEAATRSPPATTDSGIV